MWVFDILVPVLVIGIIVAAAVVIIRARSVEGAGITFSGVLAGYVALAMLVSVFLLAAGSGLLVKTGFSAAFGRDFSYYATLEPRYLPLEPGYEPKPPLPTPGYPPSDPYPVYEQTEIWVDPSEDALRDDIAAGATLAFVGLTLFAVHGLGAVSLQRRGQGSRIVTRAYNLLGLAAASIGFLGSGGTALRDILRRYVLEEDRWDPWELPHPGDPLAFAVVFLPLSLWFGWRVWQEFALEDRV